MYNFKVFLISLLFICLLLVLDNFIQPEKITKLEKNNPSISKENTNLKTIALTKEEVALFQYPNAKIISNISNSMELECSVPIEEITQWYKEKIKGNNTNIDTFMTANINGNIQNKLMGINGKKIIKVDILKKDQDPVVQVIVSTSSIN